MRGSVAKRCNCPPLYDAAGRRKACPRRHGSWSFIADVGDDPATGKRKQLKRGGFRTKEDAETALSTLLQQLQNHGWTDDKGRTVVEWMTSWLDRQEETAALRPSTITMYRYYTLGRIKSHLGNTKLRDLKRPAVTAMIRAMVATGDGPTTVHRCVAALRSGLSAAVRASLIPTNPARHVELPRRAASRANPWDPEELGAFLTAAETDRMGVLFEVLAFTGMRRGEALALRWDDLNPITRRFVVRRQLVQGSTDRCQWCGREHKVAWRSPSCGRRAGGRAGPADRRDPAMSSRQSGRGTGRMGQRLHRPRSGLCARGRTAVLPHRCHASVLVDHCRYLGADTQRSGPAPDDQAARPASRRSISASRPAFLSRSCPSGSATARSA